LDSQENLTTTNEIRLEIQSALSQRLRQGLNVDDYVDPWGNRIDVGIRPMVAALWRRGFPTRWSCGGHVDFPSLRPFVTVAFDRFADDMAIEKLRSAVTAHERNLQDLLDAYYRDRTPRQPETRLFLSQEPYRSDGRRLVGCAFKLRNVGFGDGPCSLDRTEGLAALREEMRVFARFLGGAEEVPVVGAGLRGRPPW
jgi:hypothetical protein